MPDGRIGARVLAVAAAFVVSGACMGACTGDRRVVRVRPITLPACPVGGSDLRVTVLAPTAAPRIFDFDPAAGATLDALPLDAAVLTFEALAAGIRVGSGRTPDGALAATASGAETAFELLPPDRFCRLPVGLPAGES